MTPCTSGGEDFIILSMAILPIGRDTKTLFFREWTASSRLRATQAFVPRQKSKRNYL